jgi:hypothetical protein
MEIFMSVLMVMLLLAVFVPIFQESLGTSIVSQDTTGFQATIESSTYLSIATNLVALPLWTFGLNSWINLLILLPLRVIGLISLWYIISPAK